MKDGCCADVIGQAATADVVVSEARTIIHRVR